MDVPPKLLIIILISICYNCNVSYTVLCIVLYFWSYNNKETVRRATLEMERRFMNNNDDLLTFKELDQENNAMVMSDREMAVAYLDPQLCLQSEVMYACGRMEKSKGSFCK